MKIQFKLILVGFVVIAVLMAVVGFVQIRTSKQISEHLDTIDRLSDARASLVDPALHHAGHLLALNERTLALYYQYAIGSVAGIEKEIEELHNEFDEHLEKLDAAAAAAADIDPLVGEAISHIAEELEAVENIHPLYHKIHKEQFNILQSFVAANKQSEAEQYVLNTVKSEVDSIRISLGSIEEHLDEEEINTAKIVESAIHDAAAAAAAAAGRILTVGIIAAALLALGMGVFVSRSVAKPLRELRDVADAVTKGDLTKRAEVKGQDEIGQLAAAFNKMTESLLEARRLPENILRSMKDSLFVVDTKGKITEANQAALEVLGYKKEELVGKPISKVFGKIKGAESAKMQKRKVTKYIPAPDHEQDEEKEDES